jgi:hypothetical protein
MPWACGRWTISTLFSPVKNPETASRDLSNAVLDRYFGKLFLPRLAFPIWLLNIAEKFYKKRLLTNYVAHRDINVWEDTND